MKAKARAALDVLKVRRWQRKLGSKPNEMRYRSAKRPQWSNHKLNLVEVCFPGVALEAIKEQIQLIRTQKPDRKIKGEKVQTTTIKQHLQKTREDACELIAITIIENALLFNIVNTNYWRQVLEAVGKQGNNLKGPSAYELGEKYHPMEKATKK